MTRTLSFVACLIGLYAVLDTATGKASGDALVVSTLAVVVALCAIASAIKER